MTWVWEACLGFPQFNYIKIQCLYQLRPQVKKPAVPAAAKSTKKKMTRKDCYVSLFMHVSFLLLPLCRTTSEKLPKLGWDEWWNIMLPRLGWTFRSGSRNSIRRWTKIRVHKCSWMQTGLRTGRLSIVGVSLLGMYMSRQVIYPNEFWAI